jgi:hypothetical protein
MELTISQVIVDNSPVMAGSSLGSGMGSGSIDRSASKVGDSAITNSVMDEPIKQPIGKLVQNQCSSACFLLWLLAWQSVSPNRNYRFIPEGSEEDTELEGGPCHSDRPRCGWGGHDGHIVHGY